MKKETKEQKKQKEVKCPNCGTVLPATMKCYNCGTDLMKAKEVKETPKKGKK